MVLQELPGKKKIEKVGKLLEQHTLFLLQGNSRESGIKRKGR